jgi:hypothetical protein
VGARRRLRNDAVQPVHFRSLAYHRTKTMARFDLLAQQTIFRGQLQMCRNSIQHRPQLIKIEGLGHVVVGA